MCVPSLHGDALTPLAPVQEHVVVGGGQEAMAVTTTAGQQGKFEARLYHMVFEEEIGRIKGHFGPINTVAFHPDGKRFVVGSCVCYSCIVGPFGSWMCLVSTPCAWTPDEPCCPHCWSAATRAAEKMATCGCTTLIRPTLTLSLSTRFGELALACDERPCKVPHSVARGWVNNVRNRGKSEPPCQ